MLFWDFAWMTIIGAAAVAAVIGLLATVAGVVHSRKPAVEGDCRDETLVLHGEGRRDC